MPRIMTHVMWMFQLPIGTATTNTPIARSSGSQVPLSLSSGFVPDPEKSAAKLMVHCLKLPPAGSNRQVSIKLSNLICKVLF